ncbi:MAG: Activator of (R)-2-hydroxyglutaryl-CoA dehydratase [Firmicutes bacterium]|nr:Activator of (R)-2-hydroxyglutaryl-CoA dehydratase [Bacillota bacterium]
MKVAFPHMGRVCIPLKTLFDSLGVSVIIPPRNNDTIKNTGYKYSPEYSCLPFKMILGNILYSLENGADTVIMLGGSGPCRFGYFAYMLNLIARDLGYRFKFICLEPSSLLKNIVEFKRLLRCGYSDIYTALVLGWEKLKTVDSLEALYFKTLPYISDKDSSKQEFEEVVAKLEQSSNILSINEIYRDYSDHLAVQRDIYKQFPRIGIVGDIYTLNEPYSNHNIEYLLGMKGIETTRSVYTSTWVETNAFFWKRKRFNKKMKDLSMGYLNDNIGGFAMETVYHTLDFINRDFDGILHMVPITCMPEIVSRQVLQRISVEKKIPIMSITVDEHNDCTGFETRVEAFAEMLYMRHKKV